MSPDQCIIFVSSTHCFYSFFLKSEIVLTLNIFHFLSFIQFTQTCNVSQQGFCFLQVNLSFTVFLCLWREQQPWTEEKRPGFRLISQLNRWPLTLPCLPPVSLFPPSVFAALPLPHPLAHNNSAFCPFPGSFRFIITWFLSLTNLQLSFSIVVIISFLSKISFDRHPWRLTHSPLWWIYSSYFLFVLSHSSFQSAVPRTWQAFVLLTKL